MNNPWSKLFKQPPEAHSGVQCEFCNTKFKTPNALGSHKRFAHKLEMHPEKALHVEKMFANLPQASEPTKEGSESHSLKYSVPKHSTPKTRKLRTNKQKLKLILAWEKLKHGEKAQFLLQHELKRSVMGRYI